MSITTRLRCLALSISLTGVLLLLAGCQATGDTPNPPMSHSDRMSLQNECAKMADRSEREACLERAAFDETW